MYAIVDIAGQQMKVEKDQKIFVHRLEGEEGSKVEFDQVLLIDNDKDVEVGTPVISGAQVTAKILEHMKGDKVIVFKKKRRKGYAKKNGHRQYMTQIQIEEIIEKGAKPKTAAKKETQTKTAKPEAKKEATAEKAAETKKEDSKTSATKTEAKKPAAEKKTDTAAKSTAPTSKKSTSTAKKSTGTAKKTTSTAKKSTAAGEKKSTTDRKSVV